MQKLAGQILTTRGVAAFWLTWCAAFVLMLWAVSPGRTLQDALSAELLQGHLAGGYQLRNPPLYEWLLWSAQGIAGPGPLSYLILRYSLIAVTGILFYAALLRTIASQHLAAAFSLSLVLFYWFGWEIHHSVSHSLALLAASLALFNAALAYAEQPTARGAFLLGVIVGIGLMAKWSFLLVVLSLGLALALTSETRRFYRDPRTLLVLAGAALPILPFLLWLASIDPDLIGRRALLSGDNLSAAQSLEGVRVFLTGVPLVFLPWIAFVLFFAWRFPNKTTSALSQAVAIRVASITAVTILALMATLLLVAIATGGALFGVTRFAIHYIFPFSLFAALALAGLVAQRVEEQRFGERLTIVSLAMALVIFFVKLASFYVLPGSSVATNLLPYARLADDLTRRGLGNAQFVTLSPRDAGNLAIYLPEARSLSLSARIEPAPPDPAPDRPVHAAMGRRIFRSASAASACQSLSCQIAQAARRRSKRRRGGGYRSGLAATASRCSAPIAVAPPAWGTGRGRLPQGRGQGAALEHAYRDRHASAGGRPAIPGVASPLLWRRPHPSVALRARPDLPTSWVWCR